MRLILPEPAVCHIAGSHLLLEPLCSIVIMMHIAISKNGRPVMAIEDTVTSGGAINLENISPSQQCLYARRGRDLHHVTHAEHLCAKACDRAEWTDG